MVQAARNCQEVEDAAKEAIGNSKAATPKEANGANAAASEAVEGAYVAPEAVLNKAEAMGVWCCGVAIADEAHAASELKALEVKHRGSRGTRARSSPLLRGLQPKPTRGSYCDQLFDSDLSGLGQRATKEKKLRVVLRDLDKTIFGLRGPVAEDKKEKA